MHLLGLLTVLQRTAHFVLPLPMNIMRPLVSTKSYPAKTTIFCHAVVSPSFFLTL
jgi:hypothetical protein